LARPIRTIAEGVGGVQSPETRLLKRELSSTRHSFRLKRKLDCGQIEINT